METAQQTHDAYVKKIYDLMRGNQEKIEKSRMLETTEALNAYKIRVAKASAAIKARPDYQPDYYHNLAYTRSITHKPLNVQSHQVNYGN